MARAKLNPLLGQLAGRLNDLVFRRYGNTTVVYKYTKPKKKDPSIRQKNSRNKFKDAAAYATKAMREPVKRDYQDLARKLGKGNAYNAAIKDYQLNPEIRDVAIYENGVTVRAVDILRVTKIEVVLTNANGQEVEKGDAWTVDGNLWRYKVKLNAPTNQNLKIDITAYDTPGNKVSVHMEYRNTGNIV